MAIHEIPQKEYKQASAFWFKPVEFGHHTWAVAEEETLETETDSDTESWNGNENEKEKSQLIRLFFFDEEKGVFDSIDYKSRMVMRKELQLNGFEKYEREAIPVVEPHGDFHMSEQAHRKIYSSGKFWKALPERLKLKYEGSLE